MPSPRTQRLSTWAAAAAAAVATAAAVAASAAAAAATAAAAGGKFLAPFYVRFSRAMARALGRFRRGSARGAGVYATLSPSLGDLT
jgi:hypothetical protein